SDLHYPRIRMYTLFKCSSGFKNHRPEFENFKSFPRLSIANLAEQDRPAAIQLYDPCHQQQKGTQTQKREPAQNHINCPFDSHLSLKWRLLPGCPEEYVSWAS